MNNAKTSGIMSVKKGNAIYIGFMAVVFITAIIFVLAIFARKAANQDLDYNQVLDMGENNYIIKISEAAYITDKNELSFILYSRIPDGLSEDNVTGTKPYVQSCTVYFKNGSNDDYAEKIKCEDINDITQLMTAENVSDNIKYIQLLVASEREEYYDPDTVDEFGHIVKGEKHKGSEEVQMIQIDQNDIVHLSEADYAKKVEKAADISLENLQLEEETSSEDDSSNLETTIITAPETTAPQTTAPPETTTAASTTKKKASTTAKKKTVKVTGVMLVTGFKDNKVKLEKGKSCTIKASIIPDNATNKKVTWKSSNSKIVKVNKNGKITAKAKGSAYITAVTKDGEFTASCKVTVTEKK